MKMYIFTIVRVYVWLIVNIFILQIIIFINIIYTLVIIYRVDVFAMYTFGVWLYVYLKILVEYFLFFCWAVWQKKFKFCDHIIYKILLLIVEVKKIIKVGL